MCNDPQPRSPFRSTCHVFALLLLAAALGCADGDEPSRPLAPPPATPV